jgi:O-antigen biosynthesis protein
MRQSAMTSEASPPAEQEDDVVVVSEPKETRSAFSAERKFRPIRPAAEASTEAAANPGAADGATSARRGLAIGAIESIDHQHIVGWAWYRPTPDEPIEIEVLVDDAVVLTARADRLRPDLAALGAGNGRHGFLVRNLADHLSPGPHNIRVRRARDRLDIPGSPKPVIGPERDAVDTSPLPDAPGPLSTSVTADEVPLSVNEVAEVLDASVRDIKPQFDGPSTVSAVETGEVVAGSADSAGPETAGAAKARPMGNLDRVSFDEIAGWVWDADHPQEAVDIEILDGDEVVLKVSADQFRADLADAGMGTGHHGFAIRNLGGILPLSRHRVRVRRATDGKDLPRSPMTITRNVLDQGAMTFINDVVFSAIEAAARPDDLSQPLGYLLMLLNDVVNAHEALGRTQNQAFKSTPAEAVDIMQLTGRTRDLVDQLRYAFQPLYFEPSDTPDVSIIIPVHNKFSVTYDCLDSITKAPSDRTFEIIIADDCSDDETLLAALVFAGAVRIVRNTSNLGFVRTCNAGAALARGRYLFFLNNDTLVKPGWLDELVQTFEQVPNVGIAGSKLLFPDGKLQEAGGIIWRLGDGWNWGRGRDPNDPAFSFLRDADWVSGAALMIERPLFEQLGGFDEYYAPAYYEDTDLAFRVRALGKRVVVQPASEIVHLEGVSAGTDTSGPGMKRFQVVNHAKFYRRWKDTLVTHRLNGQQPEMEAERLVRQRAYFIDDTVPTPDQDAGSNAAVEHMRALLALGYKVTFLPADNMTRIDPYTAQLQKLGIECPVHPWFWSVEEVFRKAQHKPDLVYLHRYSNASKYATMVRRYFPECRIVYNVADLHFLRMERQAEIDPTSVSAAQAAAQRRDEIAVMRNVDSVIVHSPVEAALLAESDASLKVEVVPWTVRLRPSKVPFAARSGAAFVGGFGHPPNLDAVRWLVGEILPQLRPVAPGCTTYLVGSKMQDEVAAMQRPGVVPLGFVPVLADILHKLRCTVVPLRYGAGIKGKVLESFAHGLPCVMSEVAAEGLELSGDLAWLVARSPAEFAEKLARVHEDEAFNRTLSDAGLAYIEQRYGAEVVTAALRAAVAG